MDKLCPLIKKECWEHKCRWYTRVTGKNPNGSGELDHWGCAVEWLPLLLIENALQIRQGAAAVESARNETVNAAGALAKAVVAGMSVGLERAAITVRDSQKLISGD